MELIKQSKPSILGLFGIWQSRSPALQQVAIMVNRAPVLTLWAAVVAERLGFDHEEALTLGRAVAGFNAYSKGVSLGLFEPTPETVKEQRRKARPAETFQISLLGRAVPAVPTPKGVRATSKEKAIAPASVERYLELEIR